MDQIQHVYNDLRDSNEIAIINKYGNNAKQYTAVLTSKEIKHLFISFYVGNYLMKFLLKFFQLKNIFFNLYESS